MSETTNYPIEAISFTKYVQVYGENVELFIVGTVENSGRFYMIDELTIRAKSDFFDLILTMDSFYISCKDKGDEARFVSEISKIAELVKYYLGDEYKKA